MVTFRKLQGLPGIPDAGHTIAKFKIIASNLHFNVLKYMIFVTKVVVNLHFRGWRIKCKDLEKFHRQHCQISISLYNILTTGDCM